MALAGSSHLTAPDIPLELPTLTSYDDDLTHLADLFIDDSTDDSRTNRDIRTDRGSSVWGLVGAETSDDGSRNVEEPPREAREEAVAITVDIVDEEEQQQEETFVNAITQVTNAMEQMGRDLPPPPPAPTIPEPQRKARLTVGRRFASAFKHVWSKTMSRSRPAHDCIACQESIQDGEIRVPCGHYYDKECMISLFEASTRDESLFHPRCCRKIIPFKSVRKHFSPVFRIEFLEKSREYGTAKRVYCAVPHCSRFLGPQEDGKRKLHLYKCMCGTSTCTMCKGVYEDGANHVCNDNADETVLVLGKAEGWARCPGCRAMIELNMGCHHITCLCKAEFCYLCQARWKTCTCPQWDEARLTGMAEERIDIQLQLLEAAQRPAPVLARWERIRDRDRNHRRVMNPVLPQPIARRPLREELIRVAVNELRVNHDCQHGRWRYRDGGGTCVGCHDVLDRYVFHCMDCHTIACNRCRLNRF